MRTKTQKFFYGLFLCALCLVFAAGLFVNTGCKKEKTVYYTVTFDTNGGTEIPSVEVESGTAVSKPADPTRSGYVFEGWLKLDNTPYNFAEEVTGNITLFASWKVETVTPAQTCKVTFNVDGAAYKTVTVEKGKTVQKPDDPVKVGATFDKWVTEENAEFDFTSEIQSDLTLFAKWKDGGTPPSGENYTVTFDANGGTATVASAQVISGEAVAEPEIPEKAGFDFVGWYTAEGTLYDFSTPVTADITLTAKWETEHFTVTFDSNGGSEVAAQRQTKGEKAVRPADPTKSGETFLGWFTAAGTEYDFDAPVTADITLTAKWSGDTAVKPRTFTYDYSAIALDPADKSALTQANFTGVNSFLKIAESKVTYRNKAKSADGKSPDCIECKDGGISVTFTGTGTITVSFASTGSTNVSSLMLKDASDNAVAASSKGSNVTENNGAYEITGTTADTVTFNVTAAGTYTIYCRYEYTDAGTPKSRGARITAIAMTDNY